MASPPMRWEDLETQDFDIHKLLLEHQFALDTSLLITDISEPVNLLPNSPDSTSHPEHAEMPTKQDLKVEFSVMRTPLKDTSNTYPKDDILNNIKSPSKDSTNINQKDETVISGILPAMCTPEKPRKADDSLDIQCPSSADFKEFLNAIVDVSLVSEPDEMERLEAFQKISNMKDKHFLSDDFVDGQECVKKELFSNQVLSDSPEDCGERFSGNLNGQNVSPKCQEALQPSQSDILESHENENLLVVQPRVRKGTYDLLSSSFTVRDSESASLLPEIDVPVERVCDLLQCDGNDSDSVFESGNQTCNLSFTVDKKDACHQNYTIPVLLDENENCETGIAGERHNSGSSEEGSNTSNVPVSLLVMIDDVTSFSQKAASVAKSSIGKTEADCASVELQKPAKCLSVKLGLIQGLCVSNPGVERKVATSQGIENQDLKASDKKPESSVSVVTMEDGVSLNKGANAEVKSATLTANASSCDGQATSQHKLMAVLNKDATSKKGRLSTSNLPSKVGSKIPEVEPRRLCSLQTKAPSTKLPLMKAGQMQSKLISKRTSLSISNFKTQPAGVLGNTVALGGEVCDLSKTVIKSQPGISRLGPKESRMPVKTLMTSSFLKENKPSARQIPKPAEGPRNALKIPQLPDKPRLITKVSGQQMVKVLQPVAKQLNSAQKPDLSKTVTKATRRLSVKESHSEAQALPTSDSVNKEVSVTSQQECPLMDASRTVTRDPKKKPINVLVPAAGKGSLNKGTLKQAPVKAIYPMNGSMTVTKEDQSVGSRTVTKGVQSDGTRAKASEETTEPAFSTPMKSDAVLMPRRLSNVFHMRTSEAAKGIGGKHSSGIPTPTRFNSSTSSMSSLSSNASFRKPASLSDFESPSIGRKGCGDDADAFRPRRPLVKNTPDVEPRRQSMWSPVKKTCIPSDDMPYFCTKNVRAAQAGSS